MDLISKIKSGTKEYEFIYDNFSKMKSIKLNNNLLIENYYENNNGNLIKSRYANNKEIKYFYDNLERINIIVENDKTYTYHYDNFGNVAKILSSDEKYIYGYNLGQQLINYIYKNFDNKFRIDLEYDKNNNILNKRYSLSNNFNDFENYNFNINYEYNQDDSIINITLDNNTIVYDYDYLGRIKWKNINNNLNIEYSYITHGDKTSLVVDTMKVDNNLYKYEYDDLYNITHIYLNNELINVYEYNDINELISEKDYLLNRRYKYIYDKEGNILKKQEYELNTQILLKEDKYEYTNSKWEDQLTKFNDTTFTYDEIGNPLTIGSINLTWKNGRQLNSYIDNNLEVTYLYDIEGIRTSKIVNSQSYNYCLEGNKIIFEERPEGVIYYIRDEKGELIGLEFNEQVYLYKKTLQGDIIGIYDSNYDLVVNYKYDSWGNIISITDNNGNNISDTNNIGIINPFRYRSYYYDTETKLYYLNSRYYNPLWGRFINADGIIESNENNDYNLYAYCSNNPLVYIDVTGMWKQVAGGWQAQKGDTLWGLAKMLTGNGANWTDFGYTADPRKLQVGTIIRTSNSNSINTSKNKPLTDITFRLDMALIPYASMAKAIGKNPYYSYSTFYSWVNHGAIWDIKLERNWNKMIGGSYPGVNGKVIYRGKIMTPEQLGNYTYGYLGAAMGFSINTLLMGSFYAAGHFNMNTVQTLNELYGDWPMIEMGYLAYFEVYK